MKHEAENRQIPQSQRKLSQLGGLRPKRKKEKAARASKRKQAQTVE